MKKILMFVVIIAGVIVTVNAGLLCMSVMADISYHDDAKKPIDFGPSIAESLKIKECRISDSVWTNEPPTYVLQSRYGGAWMTFNYNTLSHPCFWVDNLKNYTIYTAPRYKKSDILNGIAPKDYPYYEKKVLIFEIRKCSDNAFRLKEVKFTEMR